MIAFLVKYKSFIAAGVILVMALVIWVMAGMVSSAKSDAKAAKDKAESLANTIETMAKEQKRTSEIVTARLEADRIQAEKLNKLQVDLNETIKNDKQASDWADVRLPTSIVNRLHDDKDGNYNK